MQRAPITMSAADVTTFLIICAIWLDLGSETCDNVRRQHKLLSGNDESAHKCRGIKGREVL